MKRKEILQVENLTKVYQTGSVTVKALKDVSFNVKEGELITILGQSGSGKSTLLNLIGGIDIPSSGEVIVDDKNIGNLSGQKRTQYRREQVGFIFQAYNLIPLLTALENVELATDLIKAPRQEAKDILKVLGLEDKLNQYPSQLSGGEQQRVAIARAIVKKPKLLLCDEPTGALDTVTSVKVLTLIDEIRQLYNITVIMITHNELIAQMSDIVIYLKNGKIESIKKNENRLHPEQIEW